MVQTTDHPHAWRATMAETLLGVEPIDGILAEIAGLGKDLAATDAEYAELWAMHGPGNGWDTQRKALWCTIATEIRDAAATAGDRVTEAAIEQRAHAHPKYLRFLNDGVISRARFQQLASARGHLEARREALVMKANRGQALLRVQVPQERGG